MNKPSKTQIGWGLVVVVAVLVSLFFGVTYPLPPAPVETPVGVEARGVNVRTEKALVVENYIDDKGTLDVAGAATIGGALTVTGAITGGSFSPDTFTNASDLIANTGAFTTSLKVALTPVALLSGSAINATSLKVAATPVALLQGSAIDAASLKVALTPVALLSGSTLNETAISVAGTPVVVQVGALSGGQSVICGSTVITGTGVLPTGLATPMYVTLSLGQDVTGDCNRLSFTNAAATVTAKCYNSALTPAPATTPATVNWCVNGK